MAHDAIPLDRETMNLDTVARALRVSRPVVYDAARRIALLFTETEQGKSLCCGGDA